MSDLFFLPISPGERFINQRTNEHAKEKGRISLTSLCQQVRTFQSVIVRGTTNTCRSGKSNYSNNCSAQTVLVVVSILIELLNSLVEHRENLVQPWPI